MSRYNQSSLTAPRSSPGLSLGWLSPPASTRALGHQAFNFTLPLADKNSSRAFAMMGSCLWSHSKFLMWIQCSQCGNQVSPPLEEGRALIRPKHHFSLEFLLAQELVSMSVAAGKEMNSSRWETWSPRQEIEGGLDAGIVEGAHVLSGLVVSHRCPCRVPSLLGPLLPTGLQMLLQPRLLEEPSAPANSTAATLTRRGFYYPWQRFFPKVTPSCCILQERT